MKHVFTALALTAALYTTGCSNKDLQNADNLAATGEFQEAVEAYNKVIETGKNADKARVSLAGVFCTQKQYKKALDVLGQLAPGAAKLPDAVSLHEKCAAARNLLDGIKSATIQFRQQFIKAKEIAHEDIDYATPLFSGPAPELFAKSGVTVPPAADLDKYKVEIRQTDDPLEPTRLQITYPDASSKELSLNY